MIYWIAAFWFAVEWLYIGYVSAFDMYLAVRFRHFLPVNEQNPLCCKIIDFNDGDVSLLVWAKFCGTITVLGLLFLLYRFKQSWAHVIAFGVAVFQTWLLYHLFS